MDSERPHRTGSTSGSSSELFICFTSRLSSSSSMKISSKSILSPGRTDKFREPQISLSSSLSRRLKSNGSMKGGQSSPMFPTGSKKRGCAFENPEPSSPKVTCIGQVRVKTKKQGKKLRTRSTRRGEVSFRKIEQGQESVIHQMNHQHSNFQQQQNQQQECLPHRNQRWVHLPLTICEALRAFGAEFNCFLPCRSSCLSTNEREKEEKANGSTGESESASARSCGAAFARWLVALQEGEGKGREIELVVGEEERTERSRQRRQVMEEIEVKEDKCEEKDEVVEEEEARVSICIPPKNALLLMRCRSDPLRMAALANRFWDSPVPKEDGDDKDEDEDEDEEDEDDENEQEQGNAKDHEDKGGLDTENGEVEVCEKWVLAEAIEEHEIPEEEAKLEMEGLEDKDENAEVTPEINELQEGNSEKHEQESPRVIQQIVEAGEETVLSNFSPEGFVDPEILENEENEPKLLQEEEDEDEDDDGYSDDDDDDDDDERRASHDTSSLVSVQSEEEDEEEEEEEEEEEQEAEALAEEAEKSTEEKETSERPSEDEETVTHERSEPEPHDYHESQEKPKSEERESHTGGVERETHANLERDSSVLPDCLLLMMCEPKLSMEVSKETWVCGTDFIRCLPERPVKTKDGGDELKKRVSADSNPVHPTHLAHPAQHLQQPPRSSCSFPAPAAGAGGVSMATMIEQKLGNAVAYEPFVLTRCKSEPMRSAGKLMPEACFWKNRKLEPHRGATLGVGAAGVGF